MAYWIAGRADSSPLSDELIENMPMETFGLDWAIFFAVSEKDAARNWSLYSQGKHPLQDDLLQTGRTVRTLAYEDKAREFIRAKYRSGGELKPMPARTTVELSLEAVNHEALSGIRRIENVLGERSKLNTTWVAHIVGTDPRFKFKRAFLKPRVDYSNATNRGNRGVYYYYSLIPGQIYEINHRYNTKDADRYFVKCTSEGVENITTEEVVQCLK